MRDEPDSPHRAEFMSRQWGSRVRAAVDAGPGPDARARAVASYWDWVDRVRSGYHALWAFGVRGADEATARFLLLRWKSGQCAGGDIVDAESARRADYVITASVRDWRALCAGYPPGRAVMYRMLLLERGCVLDFFRVLYLFTESVACLASVPTAFDGEE